MLIFNNYYDHVDDIFNEVMKETAGVVLFAWTLSFIDKVEVFKPLSWANKY